MSETLQAAATAASVASAASKATYSGSLAMLGGWLVSSEAAVVGGLLLGVAGFVVNWIYRHREGQLRLREHEMRQQEHALRMAHPVVTLDTEP